MIKKASSILFLAFLASCASPDKLYQPTIAGPAAKIKFDTAATVPTRHNYIYTDSSCSQRSEVIDREWTDIPAGKPVHVAQSLATNWISFYQVCALDMEFIPEPGASYETFYSARRVPGAQSQAQCTIELVKVSADNKKTPAEFTKLPSCGGSTGNQIKRAN